MRARMVQVLTALAVVAALVVLPQAAAQAADPTFTRVAGADRFETAALVSQTTFSPGVAAVFIATGEDFPDALAASAVAAHTASPILLVRRGSIPDATANELARLKPGQIDVVGGSAAVDDSVVTQLGAYSSFVQRISGVDRYETAANLSKAVFHSTVATVFIATGRNFPDALSAGPGANQEGAPVLLVPGSGPLPLSVRNELGRLKPGTLVVLGREGAVDNGELDALQNTLPNADIFIAGGANRYTTSVMVAQFEFEQATKVVLTTGLNFPDALTAGAPAGVAHAPIMLVHPDCIPPQVNAEIVRLGATQVVVVGGPNSVGAAVLSGTICTGDQPGHISFDDDDVLVGAQGVPAGTYRTRTASDGCVWGRFSGPDYQNDALGSDFGNGPQIATIKPTDYLFSSDGCATWTNDLSPITASPTASFGDGDYFVGTDVAAGTWSAPGGNACYWKRESAFTGEDADIIADNGGSGDPIHNVTVTIAPTDLGFYTDGCGAWTKTG